MKAFLKYHIKDRWSLWQQERLLHRAVKAPVLVFTMAKVGSLSVYSSLKAQTTIPTFHIHSLDEEEERKHLKECRDRGIYPGSRTPAFLINAEIIKPERPYKVISLVRNPIERNISAFFDAFEFHMGVKPSHYKGSIAALEKVFHEKIDPTYAVGWFDTQFLNGTGIDVYRHRFDKKSKHGTIRVNTIDVLILRSDLLDASKEKLIAAFCAISPFSLQNVNLTSTKKGALLYQKFKDDIKFSKTYLESQLETPYAHHFYTEAEREALYTRWGR